MKCFDCGIYRAPPIVIPNQYGRVSVAYRDGDDLAVVQQLYDCTPRDGVDVAELLGILNTTSSSTRRWPPPGRSRTRRCRGTPAHRRHAHRPGPRNRRPRSLRHADHKGALAPQLHLEPRGRRLAAIHALRVRASHVFVPALLDDLPRIVAIVRESPGGVDHAGAGDLVLKHGAPTMEGPRLAILGQRPGATRVLRHATGDRCHPDCHSRRATPCNWPLLTATSDTDQQASKSLRRRSTEAIDSET